jgi:acetoacetyl-CoA synthetase
MSPDRSEAVLQRFADRFAPATNSPERQAYLQSRAAFDGHRPSRYDGAVVYYRAQRSLRWVGTSLAAWRRVAPQLVVTDVPGHSSELLGGPFLDELAARVSATLR